MPPKDQYLQDNFNLSAAEWQAIWDYQKGLCGVCGQPLKENKCYTEHAHGSGEIRGITCFRCNAAIREYFTTTLVAQILEYLLHPPATAALGHPHYGLPGRVGTATRRALIKKLRKQKAP